MGKYCFSGPVLVTDKLTSTCRIGQRYSELNILDSNHVKTFNVIYSGRKLVGEYGDTCFHVTVLGHHSFYPIKAHDRRKLFISQDPQYWRFERFYWFWISMKLKFRFAFRRSLSVHFYGQITGNYRIGNMTAYDYLAPQFCPKAYSLRNYTIDDTWW